MLSYEVSFEVQVSTTLLKGMSHIFETFEILLKKYSACVVRLIVTVFRAKVWANQNHHMDLFEGE